MKYLYRQVKQRDEREREKREKERKEILSLLKQVERSLDKH
jgi:hypothetical protein